MATSSALDTQGPLYLLGVGCQKGGTSWLYDYLARSPACAPGIAKEATIFDALDVPQHTVNRQRILERAEELVEAGLVERIDVDEQRRRPTPAPAAQLHDTRHLLARASEIDKTTLCTGPTPERTAAVRSLFR